LTGVEPILLQLMSSVHILIHPFIHFSVPHPNKYPVYNLVLKSVWCNPIPNG